MSTGVSSIEEIAYFAELDFSRSGGPSVNERDFIESLARRFEDRALVAVPGASGLGEASGATTLDVPLGGGIMGAKRALHTASRIAAAFEGSRARFIVARMGQFPWVLYWLVHRHRVPLALRAVGVFWADAATMLGLRDQLAWRLQTALSRSVVRKAAFVDTVTPELAAQIRARTGRGQVHVVGNSTNVERFTCRGAIDGELEAALVGSSPVIGYVGQLPSVRAVPHFLELAPALLRRYPRARFIIAGWDPQMSDNVAKVEGLGLSEHFFFLGEIEYGRVPGVMRRLDVGISFDDPGRARMVGNSSQKVRQYLACGTPVVAIDVGNRFIEEADLGRLVPAGRLDLLPGAVLGLLEALDGSAAQVRQRCRDFAVAHLSTTRSLEVRLEWWAEHFGAGGSPP